MRSARNCSSRLSVASRASTLSSNSITTYRSSNVIRSSRFVSRNSPLLTFGSRKLWTKVIAGSPKSRMLPWLVGIVAGVATATTVLTAASTNWDSVRNEIKSILHDEKHDDGHYGPILVRLAWHAAGTYVHETRTGGSNGATMRFGPEAGHGANKGLHIARDLLEKVKQKHPEVSYADLWTLAGCVAIEEMGGPHIPWRSGRVDHPNESRSPPEGRLPDASKDRVHIKEVFYRMGFNDQEIVALLGAHAIGRCHTDRSGYHGPWTTSPTTFTNNFYVHLLQEKWTLRKWEGPKQYQDETGTLMMLPTDIELANDPGLKKYVELYAKDEEQFFRDFAKAFSKLLELGVEFPVEPLEKVAPKGTPTPKQQEESAKESGWRSWLGLGGGKKN